MEWSIWDIFSFLLLKLEKKTYKSNRKKDIRKFQWKKRQTTSLIRLRNRLSKSKSSVIRKCVLFHLKKFNTLVRHMIKWIQLKSSLCQTKVCTEFCRGSSVQDSGGICNAMTMMSSHNCDNGRMRFSQNHKRRHCSIKGWGQKLTDTQIVIITELGEGDLWGKGRGRGRYSLFYIQNKTLVILPFLGLQFT